MRITPPQELCPLPGARVFSLPLPQGGVEPALAQQGGVGSLLGYPASIDHEDLVSVHRRSKGGER